MAKAIAHFVGAGEPGEISGTITLFQVKSFVIHMLEKI